MNSIYKQYKPENSNDLYLRLKDGDNVKMRIHSQPVITLYKEGDRPRYAWVIINHDSGKAQVFGAGVSIYSQIALLVEDWGEVTEFDIKVSRKGSGMQDTEYSVIPVKNSTAPTKEQEAEADKIDLINATKGKWLSEFVQDQILPDPVLGGTSPVKPSQNAPDPVIEDMDEQIDLKDIPFGDNEADEKIKNVE